MPHHRASALLLWALLLAPCHTQTCGDCNQDGSVSVTDALTAAQLAAGMLAPTGAQAQVCDVDQNLSITVLDALRMAQVAAGLTVPLTCPGGACSITSPVGSTWSGTVVIGFDLPAGGPAAAAHLEFSTDAGVTFDTTCTAASSPLQANPTGPLLAGASYVYAWDSVCDGVGAAGPVPVILRITMGAAGACTSSFSVDNQQPPAPSPIPGDLLICEVLQNPLAVADTQGEWFEVQNLTFHPVELNGCTIRDDGVDSHVIASALPLIVQGGDRLVLGINDDPATNGNVAVDYEYSGFELGNADDEIIVEEPGGVEVVRIMYDGGPLWPDPNGASMSLDPTVTDPIIAQDPMQWCQAQLPWGPSSDLGSPGAANASCWGLPTIPPWCAVLNPLACHSGTVPVDLDLMDPDSPTVSVTIRYSTDQGVTWALCTPAAASPPPLDVNPAPAVPALGPAQLLWDSAADLPGASALVVLQAEVNDGTAMAWCEATILVDNLAVNQPPSCTISAPAGGTVPGWDVTMTFDLVDPDSPALLVDLERSTDGGATWARACLSPTSPPPFDTLPALAATGAGLTLTWDSLCDAVSPGAVMLRLSADDCASTSTCSTSFTLTAGPAADPQPGDLLISEVLQDPAVVPDAQGEWFEVVNVSGATLDLAGCTLRDDGTDSHVIAPGGPLPIQAGARIVLGLNDDPATNGNVTVAYEYTGFTLGNDDDEVVIENLATVEVVRVAYDGGILWPDPTGASMSLEPAILDPTLAQNPSYWCMAMTPWGATTDLGSPGLDNEPCWIGPGLPPMCWATTAACATGDVTIDLTIDDPDTPLLDATVWYSTDGGLTSALCTPAVASPPPFDVNPASGVPTGPGQQLVWDSLTDLGAVSARVQITIELFDGMFQEWCDVSLVVDNLVVNTPPTCQITSPTGSVSGGSVPIRFDLVDPDSPGLVCTFEVSTDGGATWALACPDAASPSPYHENPAVGERGTAREFWWDNLCNGVGPGSVDLRLTVDDCQSTSACSISFSLSSSGAVSPQPFDLLITEIMQDPAAVPDAQGEWFELLNLSGQTIDLDGCTIEDLGTDSHVIAGGGPLAVPPMERVVLGVNADPGTNGGVQVDYEYTGLTLGNADDEIIIRNPTGVELVRVEYDGGVLWPDPTGATLNLDDLTWDPIMAQDPMWWCIATQAWAAGSDLGSPRTWNEPCMLFPTVPPTCSLSAGGCGSGDVSATVTLDDPDSPLLDVTVRYSTSGGATWDLCTMAASSPPPLDHNPASGVPVPAPPYQLVWDSLTDLGAVTLPVLLQVVGHDGSSGSTCEEPWVIDNLALNLPPTIGLTAPTGSVAAGYVDVVFDLADPDSPAVRCTIEHSTDAGLTWQHSTPAPTSQVPYDRNPAVAAPGTGQTFVWCSSCDGVNAGVVQLRGTADDCATSVQSTIGCTLTAPGGVPPTTLNQIVLSEGLVMPDPGPTGDANGDGVGDPIQDEFLELVNITPIPLDLSGVTISDMTGVRHTFPPGTVIPSGRAVVVFGGGTPTGTFGGNTVQTASTGMLDLDDWGEDVLVLDPTGQILDQYFFGMMPMPPFSETAMPEPSSLLGDPGGRPMQPHLFLPPGLTFSPGTMADGVTGVW
jgi:hypothetical protein